MSLTSLKIKQLGLFAEKKSNMITNKFYIPVKGEMISGAETNNVYNTFRHILEDYDSITNIDYNNLSSNRNDWYSGRQITEQRNSFDYLKELAEESFVGIATTRTGDIGLTAWMENLDSTYTHNQTNIIRDSLTYQANTNMSQLYNEFDISFSWNPGASKYDRNIFIKKIDESAFPASSSDTWKTFVGGVGDYGEAKYLWEQCHQSYLDTGIKRRLKKELKWFPSNDVLSNFCIKDINRTRTFGSPSTEVTFTSLGYRTKLEYSSGDSLNFLTNGVKVGDVVTINSNNFNSNNNGQFAVINEVTDTCIILDNPNGVTETKTIDVWNGISIIGSSVFDFVDNLLDWVIYQRNIVTYNLPINSTNIKLELLDTIYFSDTIYTRGETKTGWIINISTNPQKNIMTISLMLSKNDKFNNAIIQDTFTSQEPTNADWQDVTTDTDAIQDII